MWASASSTKQYDLMIDCYDGVNTCAGWTLANYTGVFYKGLVFRGVITPSPNGTLIVFSQALASTSAPVLAGQLLSFRLFHRVDGGDGSAVGTILYGTSSPAYCTTNCVGTPFFSLASETIVFDWSIYTTEPGSTALFQGDATSTFESIGDRCADSGNLFSRGICTAFAFLFVPNPETLNGFASLSSTSAQHFPISWFYETRDVVSGLNASSTVAMASFSFDLQDLGVGSTTALGNILPNITVFSSTTVTEYMGESTWDIIQLLIGAALWLGLLADIWFTTRNLFHV